MSPARGPRDGPAGLDTLADLGDRQVIYALWDRVTDPRN